MPRNVHHYFSLFGPAGMGKSTFRRGELVPVYEIDFGVVLSPGDTLVSATWYCSQPYSVIMSNPTITARSTAVTLNCQIQAGSLLKVVATTSSGAHHSYQAEVLVRSGWWFQGDNFTLVTGPYTLYVESGLSITGHLPDSIVSKPVNYAYTVIGNFGPNIVTLIGGSLPPGLVISPSGVVTGTPTADGTFNWLLQVTDYRGFSATHADVTIISTALSISGALGDGSVGDVVSYQYTVSGGVPPYGPVNIVSGSIPAGLTISSAGLAAGTRTTFGVYTFRLQVTDSVGAVAFLDDTSKTAESVIYVTNTTANTVSVIRYSTGALVATVAVGTGPNGLAVNPAGTFVYSANTAANTVSVIDTATNLVVATIPVGTGPQEVCVSKDGTRAYTADQAGQTVSVINLATNTLISSVAKGVAPFSCAANWVNGDIYVVDAVNSQVFVLNPDGSTKATVGFTNPSGVGVSPDGLFFYVVGFDGIACFDATTHAALGAMGLRGGYGPQSVVITPDGNTAYVSDYNYTDMKVVNTTNKGALSLLTSIAGVGLSKLIAMDPSGARVYVAGTGGYLSVIDTQSNTLITTYPYGNYGVISRLET